MLYDELPFAQLVGCMKACLKDIEAAEHVTSHKRTFTRVLEHHNIVYWPWNFLNELKGERVRCEQGEDNSIPSFNRKMHIFEERRRLLVQGAVVGLDEGQLFTLRWAPAIAAAASPSLSAAAASAGAVEQEEL